MRRLSSLAVVLVLSSASCAPRPGAAANSARQALTAHSADATPAVAVSDVRRQTEGEENRTPPEWQGVDFKNFAYPVSWGRRTFKLVRGEYEYYQDKGFGDSNGWFDLEDVHYADVTGDGRPEAIVTVSAVNCGGSCDGGAHLFYFYAAGGRKPKLFWRLETGSLGYGCGLKSFEVRGRAVTVETFKTCDFDGGSFDGDDERERGEPVFKFSAKTFTRFTFEYEGRRFALKRREVFPNPQENVNNYSPAVSISDE
ncbi:MAG TPA: hypothetical protein VF521_18735 [Pyrinomonadaceae bacterium]|jgi:hypothetical protein